MGRLMVKCIYRWIIKMKKVGIVASMRTIEQQNTEYRKGRDENGNNIPGGVRTTGVQGGYS
jgi:hypothetical protein